MRKKYKVGKIQILSDIELNKAQVGKIVDIVNELMLQGFYEPCYQISRKIYYDLEQKGSIAGVETKRTKSGNFKIRVSKK